MDNAVAILMVEMGLDNPPKIPDRQDESPDSLADLIIHEVFENRDDPVQAPSAWVHR